MFNKSFLINFAKHLAYFVGGCIAMIGFINVMAWLFGKTAAIVIAWVVLIFGWIAAITMTITPMPKLADEQVDELAKAMNVHGQGLNTTGK